ncbi:MAG: hypothetical protein WC663_04360 [Patescibacteria group bacterium]|jgi:mannose-6-phosphate isomerase-like protein (cupin superfamily)
MQIANMLVSKNKAEKIKKPNCVIYEYGGNRNLSLCVVKIKKRYPKFGLAMNEKVDEMYYILKGKGKFFLDNKIFKFKSGDMILIEKKKWYYVEGDFEAIIPTSPFWTINQYKEKK